MDINKLKNIDAFLKMISNALQTKHSYKMVCKYKDSLVTLDFVLPFKWNDEFYCCEPQTINSLSDNKKRVFVELNSQFQVMQGFLELKFQQLLNHYKNRETNYLMIYLLENDNFYNFDVSYSKFGYNVKSLDKNWKLPIIKLDNSLEFISLQLVEHEQN